MQTTPAQSAFLEDEFFPLTLGAVARRGSVYLPQLTEQQRRILHVELRDALLGLVGAYSRQVTGAAHIANIVRLADRVSAQRGPVLADGRFRIGSAQKALNLYLKYRWCLGLGPEPPHCPFDGIVLQYLRWKGPRWTALDSREHYQQLVVAARARAGMQSIALWELEVYNQVFQRAR